MGTGFVWSMKTFGKARDSGCGLHDKEAAQVVLVKAGEEEPVFLPGCSHSLSNGESGLWFEVSSAYRAAAHGVTGRAKEALLEFATERLYCDDAGFSAYGDMHHPLASMIGEEVASSAGWDASGWDTADEMVTAIRNASGSLRLPEDERVPGMRVVDGVHPIAFPYRMGLCTRVGVAMKKTRGVTARMMVVTVDPHRSSHRVVDMQTIYETELLIKRRTFADMFSEKVVHQGVTSLGKRRRVRDMEAASVMVAAARYGRLGDVWVPEFLKNADRDRMVPILAAVCGRREEFEEILFVSGITS